jgi:glycosyltransferase involved in cell wall biosynthesis
LVVNRAYSDLRSWSRLLASTSTIRKLFHLISSGGYDVVHVNNTFTYQAPTLLAAKRAGKPIIAHVQNPIERSPFSRRMMRLADCIVTINRSLERELRAWGLPVEIHACYQCVELPPPDKLRSLALRASLVQPGEILIGSVGRLDVQKGYQDFIVAARRVADAHREARFAIVGEGPLRSSLERLIRDMRLTDRFTLCGFRSDVADFLSAIDYFVCSSLWEGGPLVVIEAMLLGKPVIATSVGLIPEVILTGRTGYLVTPSDPKALADAILQALDSTRDRTLQARAARDCAMALTDPDSNARVFDDLIQQMAQRLSAR